jgi:hypothetical protein
MSFGRPLRWTLIVSTIAFFGSIGCFLVGLYPPPVVPFLASLIALIAAPIAVTGLIRRAALRSSGNVLLTVATTIVSLPAVVVALYFCRLLLPLTSGERAAIATAEAFVLRNGYTPAGHPRDVPVVDNFAQDRSRTRDEVVEARHSLLKPRAFGVIGTKWLGYSVMFEYTDQPASATFGPGRYFVVYIQPNGDTGVLQTMPMYPDWYIKRNAP